MINVKLELHESIVWRVKVHDGEGVEMDVLVVAESTQVALDVCKGIMGMLEGFEVLSIKRGWIVCTLYRQ